MASTTELLDQALAREYGRPADIKPAPQKQYLLNLSFDLWGKIQKAADLNGISVAAWLRLQAAACAQEQIHNAEVERQAAGLELAYLRVAGRSSMAGSIR